EMLSGYPLAVSSPHPTRTPVTPDCGAEAAPALRMSPSLLLPGPTSASALQKESLAPQAWTCRPCLFPRPRELRQLQRPVALEAELALTLKVLGTVADASQGDILDQPLHMLRHIHSELRACVSTGGTQAVSTQGRLHHWLSQLHKAPKKSLSCLEASVMFNLFYLLIRDLKGVTSEDPCV
uniref:Interferon lambda-3-like n=1 Tax=Panthera leo TaxID=9689 RepID=A0A8C8XAG6_PANLE